MLSNSSLLLYHLDNVNCNGDESTLSECEHRGVGVQYCFIRDEEAGVICSCKFSCCISVCVIL